MIGLENDLLLEEEVIQDVVSKEKLNFCKTPEEKFLLGDETTDEDIRLFEEEHRENSTLDVKVINEKIMLAAKSLYNFSKREDKSAAATEAISYLSQKAGIPFGIPVPLAYGFVLILDSAVKVSDMLYSKDANNQNVIESLNWLIEDGVCFVARLNWDNTNVMNVYITINKNTIQMIYQCPETISFIEGAASFTSSAVARTNVTRISMRLLYKLLKRDFSAYDDMVCWYSEVPSVVERKKSRIEEGAVFGGMFPLSDNAEEDSVSGVKPTIAERLSKVNVFK